MIIVVFGDVVVCNYSSRYVFFAGDCFGYRREVIGVWLSMYVLFVVFGYYLALGLCVLAGVDFDWCFYLI